VQVGPDGASKEEIDQLPGGIGKIGLSQCVQAKWLKVDKEKVRVSDLALCDCDAFT
jgi:hypothetical protein